MQAEGFNALPLLVQFAIREKVETFDNFTSDKDPYGVNDFGSTTKVWSGDEGHSC